MTIPKLHYISQGISSKEHLENIQKACSSGSELVLLNLKNVSEKKHLKIAVQAREITAHFQTRLIISEDYKIAKTIKADGVHFEKPGTCSIARKHLYSWQLIGATANTIQDCERLVNKEVDYIYLSPFKLSLPIDSSPTILGLNGYATIIEELNTETPIIGFGEIKTQDVTAILKTGITGIAVSNAITQDFNTISIFHKLLNASSTQEQRYTF